MPLRNDSRAETRMGKYPSNLTPIAAGISASSPTQVFHTFGGHDYIQFNEHCILV